MFAIVTVVQSWWPPWYFTDLFTIWFMRVGLTLRHLSMNKNTLLGKKNPANYQSWSGAEEVDSCLVELWVLLKRSFPEVTNEIVIEFTLAHGRHMQTRRTLTLLHLGSSRAAGLDLAQLSLPLFLFCFLSFVCCSYPLYLIVIIFSFISSSCLLFFKSFTLSFSPHPPTFLSP